VCDAAGSKYRPTRDADESRPRGLGIDSTSVFVDAYFAIKDGTDTVVLYDSKHGLKNLVSCTADLGGGFTAIAIGFFSRASR